MHVATDELAMQGATLQWTFISENFKLCTRMVKIFLFIFNAHINPFCVKGKRHNRNRRELWHCGEDEKTLQNISIISLRVPNMQFLQVKSVLVGNIHKNYFLQLSYCKNKLKERCVFAKQIIWCAKPKSFVIATSLISIQWSHEIVIMI